MVTPIRIHPDNPKCLEFRGQPISLVTATEHYGAVMNRPFQFERYLADAGEKHITLTRLFVLFRELQNYVNPYSTCKPESPDYIAPFRRVGPANAMDAQPQYDLDQWNPEFFERLHRFISLAGQYGIIVEVTLLSNSYAPEVWMLNPLRRENNVNDIEQMEFYEYNTLRHPKLFARQAAHVRKIVEETHGYDNIIYEICNEPGGCYPGVPTAPNQAEVNEWQRAIAGVIRETEDRLGTRHLISGQEAFLWSPWEQSSDLSFTTDFPIDIVNMHPLPYTTFGGKSYDQGTFMSKQLKLAAVRDYCQATYAAPKPLNLDEDNVASQYKDYDGWTIHRKRAWTTLLCGAHYDVIDFSIINYCETGTEASRRGIRTWMKHLSDYIRTVDVVHGRPLPGRLTAQPEHTVETVFGIEGQDTVIYLADDRELAEPGAGEAIEGAIALDLPAGQWKVTCFSPEAGQAAPTIRIAGGPATRIELPEFRHDLVIRLRKA